MNNNYFKNFNADLALNLVSKLPHAPSKFNLDSVLAYYKRFLYKENHKFSFSPTSKDEVLKLLKNTKTVKAVDAVVLASTISKLCNLSMKRSKFSLDCKIARLNPLYKKGSKTDSKNNQHFTFATCFKS